MKGADPSWQSIEGWTHAGARNRRRVGPCQDGRAGSLQSDNALTRLGSATLLLAARRWGLQLEETADSNYRQSLDLASLRLFVQAVEHGSLSKVAERNNMALAAVSKRIAQLEDYYHVRLLQRTGRGVITTPAGVALMQHAADIFRKVHLSRRELSDYARGVIGTVRLFASTSAISQMLPADLAAFGVAQPDIRVDLREAYSGAIAARVRDGTADMGVVIANPGMDGLDQRLYRRDRLVLLAPRDFNSAGDSIRLRDLVDADFVLMEDDAAITSLLLRIAASRGITLRVRARVDSFDGVCRMVQSGFGVGILPAMIARHSAAAMELRLIDLDEDWAERQMLIVTNPRFEQSRATRQLADFLAFAASNCD